MKVWEYLKHYSLDNLSSQNMVNPIETRFLIGVGCNWNGNIPLQVVHLGVWAWTVAGPHAELPRGGSGPVWQIAGSQGLHVTSSVPSPTEETNTGYNKDTNW